MSRLLWQKTLETYRQSGLLGISRKARRKFGLISNNVKYRYQTPKFSEKVKQAISEVNQAPLISILLPVQAEAFKQLRSSLTSVKQQWYPNWQLCIVANRTSGTVLLNYLQSLESLQNVHISWIAQPVDIATSLNAALALANGEYVLRLNPGDTLTVDALYELAKRIQRQQSDVIYSDEDQIARRGRYSKPLFKPDFSPDMLLSTNYFGYLTCIKKCHITQVGGFSEQMQGAQMYDLLLRVLENTSRICHITRVLYHRQGSKKAIPHEGEKKAFEQALQRRQLAAVVSHGPAKGTYRVKYRLLNNPLISIIIPFKDKAELLSTVIRSILEKSTYQHFEIIGMSNNSEEQATKTTMQELEQLDSRVKFYEHNVPFNYSAINNYAVYHYANGEQLIFLNNDTEVITDDWMESLLEFSQRKDVAAVGAKLLYPNDTIQHAGVIIGIHHGAKHAFTAMPKDHHGYMARAAIIQNVSAVTAACMMVKKAYFLQVGGFDEKLVIAFNDTDLCLRFRQQGWLNVYTPYCQLYHYEHCSRGAVHRNAKEKLREYNELNYFRQQHAEIFHEGDPYYNPNLSLARREYSLKSVLERRFSF